MKKNVFKEITLMNAILCLCVVMIHLTSAPVENFSSGSIPHILAFSVNKSLCFCVPAFIFLSGFKLYANYGDSKIDLMRFWSGRLQKIVIPYIIAVLVYFICFYFKRTVNFKDLPMHILLGTLVAHFYYIIIAVQAYLLFPFLKTLFNKWPLAVLILSFVCTAVFNQFIFFTYRDRFIGTYIFYLILGMAFAKYRVYEKGKPLFITAFMSAMIVGGGHFWFLYTAITKEFMYRYANLITVVYVSLAIVSVYGICLKLINALPRTYTLGKKLSAVSYNVYLYHFIVIFIFQYNIFPRLELSVATEFYICATCLYGMIFAYSFIHDKFKKFNKKSLQL